MTCIDIYVLHYIRHRNLFERNSSHFEQLKYDITFLNARRSIPSAIILHEYYYVGTYIEILKGTRMFQLTIIISIHCVTIIGIYYLN